MNCDIAQDLLLDHAEGCLEGPQASALEQHLIDCDVCRLALQQTRELVGAMDDIRRREESASRSSRESPLMAELSGWQVGSQLGDFEILGEIGRGGMGIVYRARQTSLNRLVALKVLPGIFRQVPSAVSRFKKEAQAAAKLHHTNIVPVYAQGEHEGHFYYAMELIDGESLGHILKKDGDSSLTVAALVSESLASQSSRSGDSQITVSSAGRRGNYQFVARLIAGVAEGLEHAHKQGVIHRDIKPQNLLMAPDGQLRITDFGLARLLDEPNITLTGEMVGTPAYMSPEQVTGDRRSIDHRTDIYSLGVTLYEVLTGFRPFQGAGREQVIGMILTREPKPPRRMNSHVPIDLETICLRAMEREPGRRYASAGAMAADLRRFADDRPILVRRAGPIERVVKWVRRHPALTAIYSLALLLVIVTTIWRVQAVRARHARANELVRQAYSILAYEDYREPDEAMARLKQAEPLGADEWEWRRALGLAKLHTDPMQAIEHLTWVVAQMPTNADSFYLLAWAQRLQADRVDPAVKKSLEQGQTLGGPTSAEGHFFKGMVLIREMDEAEKEFRRACEMRSNYTQAILHLGRALNHWMYHNRKHDKFDEQVRYLKNACDLQPKAAYPRYLLSIAYRLSAEIYDESGDPKSAEEPFAQALKYAKEAQAAEPESARGYVAEAEYWETKRDYEKALELRNQSEPYCLKPEPRAELYQYRWRLHFWLGHHEAGLKDLQALAEVRGESDPKRAWYRGLFPALIQADQGKMDEAVATVLAVMREQPRSFRATTAAASLLRMIGRFGEARSVLTEGFDRVVFEPTGRAELSSRFMRASYWVPHTQHSLEKSMSFLNTAEERRDCVALPFFLSATSTLTQGDRTIAVWWLRQCDAAYDSEDYCYLARVFVRKMEMDASWPSWPLIRP